MADLIDPLDLAYAALAALRGAAVVVDKASPACVCHLLVRFVKQLDN